MERLAQDAHGDLLYTFTRAWSDGTTGIQLSPGAITPTPRQQGIEAQASPASSRLGWARLLKQVFSIDLERCPRCHLGALRIVAAIPSRPLSHRILSISSSPPTPRRS